jgi:hypothetical protein
MQCKYIWYDYSETTNLQTQKAAISAAGDSDHLVTRKGGPSEALIILPLEHSAGICKAWIISTVSVVELAANYCQGVALLAAAPASWLIIES